VSNHPSESPVCPSLPACPASGVLSLRSLGRSNLQCFRPGRGRADAVLSRRLRRRYLCCHLRQRQDQAAVLKRSTGNQISNVNSKCNSVTHYRLYHILKVITFRSNNGSNFDRAITSEVITFRSINFSPLC
jgi:hypothetical protein